MGGQAVLLGHDCWFLVMAAIGIMAGRLTVLNVFDIFILFCFGNHIGCISLIISLKMILKRCQILVFLTTVMKICWKKTQ